MFYTTQQIQISSSNSIFINHSSYKYLQQHFVLKWPSVAVPYTSLQFLLQQPLIIKVSWIFLCFCSVSSIFPTKVFSSYIKILFPLEKSTILSEVLFSPQLVIVFEFHRSVVPKIHFFIFLFFFYFASIPIPNNFSIPENFIRGRNGSLSCCLFIKLCPILSKLT